VGYCSRNSNLFVVEKEKKGDDDDEGWKGDVGGEEGGF